MHGDRPVVGAEEQPQYLQRDSQRQLDGSMRWYWNGVLEFETAQIRSRCVVTRAVIDGL